VIVRDITQRKQTEFERETAVEFLKEVNQCTSTNALVEASAAFFQKKSGCEAVGVRLKKGDDYPYYEARGFPDRFVAAENSLCARTETGAILRDGSGNPLLECMCGNVINSRFDPSQPFFTAGGSFWTNSTTELLASTSESDRQARTRNRCHGEGFESVALIPLAYGEEQLGLLQLNDRRRGLFTPEMIALWERLAGYLSLALAKSRAGEALRISEDHYRRIVETASEGIWAMDSANLTTYVNRRMAEMLGYTPEEMIGQAVDTFMFAEELDDHRAKMAILQKGGAGVYERRFCCKDGCECWTIVSATALRDAKGEFAGSFAMLTDITERKLAEKALQESERFVRATLDSLSSHIAIVDETGVIITVNKPWRDYAAANPPIRTNSCEGANYFQACTNLTEDSAEGAAEFAEGMRAVLAGKLESFETEYPCHSPHERRWFAGRVTRFAGKGPVRLVVAHEDITERKRAEEVLQARLRLSEAAGTLALEELLQQSLDEAERITGSCIGFFHFVEEDQQTLLLQMWSKNTLENLCTSEGKGRHYSVEEAGVWGDCIRARRPVIHNDYAALPHRKGLPPGHAPVVRELVVPILRNGRIVAVVGVGNKPQDYDEKDVEAMSSLADLVWEIVLRKMAEDQINLQGLVLDQTRDHVAITNLEGVIIYTNQAECNAAKRQQEELIGKNVSIFGEDPQRGATQQGIIDATLSMGEWQGEVVNIAADGTESIVDLRTFLVRGKTGKALAMCGIGTDITAGKKMEAALRESEERFRLTFDEAPVGAAIVSPDFRFIAVNAALCRITGYSAEDLTGVGFGEVTHPDDIAADIKKAQQLLHGEINQYDIDKRYIHRNGGEAWIHLWVKLLRDKAGRPLYFLPIMEDITERKKAEEELRQSQMKLRDLHRQLQNAREDERSRISRDIHDELGQYITALKIDLAWLKRKTDPKQLGLLQKLESMNGVADATLQTIRRVSSEMRPGVLDALGLAAGVDWLVKDFEKRTEIQCVLYIAPEEIAVEPNLATDVFRVLQETLTNIARHAQASMVWVTLRQTPDAIELKVADNGIGISEEKISKAVSLGLLGIRERLLSWGGTLSVTGLPGEGTSIRAFIPTEGKGGLV
jgi:PAS domain S-box-containing protein